MRADRYSTTWPGFWAIFLAFLLLTAALVAGATGMASAQTPDATPTAQTEAEELPASNPFPATDSMTETVQAVLDEYERAGADAVQEEGNEPASTNVVGPLSVLAKEVAIYVPNVRSGQSSGQTPRTPTPTPPPAPRADIATTIWPSPSIRVARNGTLAYEIRVKNHGAGTAASHHVTLPYNAQQMAVTHSSFTKAGDWVSEKTNDRVTVTFGPIASGEYRTATIFFKVASTLVDNTVLSMRAPANWIDAGPGGDLRSNWAPVLASPGNASAAWVWMTVDMLGGYPGTTHRFFSDRFIPGEGIITWLNTPKGVQALDLRGTADTMGRISMDFRSTGLQRGTYSMVFYGARSNLTGVTTFYVW